MNGIRAGGCVTTMRDGDALSSSLPGVPPRPTDGRPPTECREHRDHHIGVRAKTTHLAAQALGDHYGVLGGARVDELVLGRPEVRGLAAQHRLHRGTDRRHGGRILFEYLRSLLGVRVDDDVHGCGDGAAAGVAQDRHDADRLGEVVHRIGHALDVGGPEGLPATLISKSVPTFLLSNTSTGGTLESEQPTTTAKGSWPFLAASLRWRECLRPRWNLALPRSRRVTPLRSERG